MAHELRQQKLVTFFSAAGFDIFRCIYLVIYLVPYQGSIPWSGLGPWGCQSASRSILFLVDKCSRLLNTSTLSESTTFWSSEFQMLITRSEKKWRRISLLVQCLDIFNVCPLVCPERVSWNIDSKRGWSFVVLRSFIPFLMPLFWQNDNYLCYDFFCQLILFSKIYFLFL